MLQMMLWAVLLLSGRSNLFFCMIGAWGCAVQNWDSMVWTRNSKPACTLSMLSTMYYLYTWNQSNRSLASSYCYKLPGCSEDLFCFLLNPKGGGGLEHELTFNSFNWHLYKYGKYLTRSFSSQVLVLNRGPCTESRLNGQDSVYDWDLVRSRMKIAEGDSTIVHPWWKKEKYHK